MKTKMQKRHTLPSRLLKRLTPIAAAFLAIACGGGGGGSGTSEKAGIVEGTASIGAALADASVLVMDQDGDPVCSEPNIVTEAAGTYRCTLLAGKKAPFKVVVSVPGNTHEPLFSIGTETPAAGRSVVINVTPLTTAIVGQLSPDGDGDAFEALEQPVDEARLKAITANILAQIEHIREALGITSDYDPFDTPFRAATATEKGDTTDQLIDLLRFDNIDGTPTIATFEGEPTPLAGDASTSSVILQPPSVDVASLSESAVVLARALNECFAQAVSDRVTAKDTNIPLAQGGPEVLDGNGCDDIVTDDFLQNGYRSGQLFYALLTSEDMVGAKWTPAEILRVIDDASPDDHDLAVINLRFTAKNGEVGNVLTVAIKYPGTATSDRPSEWWLHGNQQPVEASVRAYIRRNEQLAPNPGSGTFANASASRFETGINIFINKDGPGSTGLRAARVKGPGLPPAGLVYTPPAPSIITSQNWLNIRRKDGDTDPNQATPADDVGNVFKLQRTRGLIGDDSTTVRPNPNEGNADNSAYVAWAHPLDYGEAPGSSGYIDFDQLGPNATYTIEYFYEGETLPRYTVTKTLLQAVMPATRGGKLPWANLTSATRDYLDPTNPKAAATASMNLAWNTNPYAEAIHSAAVYTFGSGQSISQGQVPVEQGATSAAADAPTGFFPTLTNDGSSSRAIQLRYFQSDGSYKDSLTRYN